MRKKFSTFFIFLYVITYRIQSKSIHGIINLLTNYQIFREGFWLSVLSDNSLQAIDSYYYKNAKKYFNDDFNRKLLSEWEEKMVNLFYSQCKNIMVLASGGGREVYALLKKNYKVDAFECSQALVDYSSKFLNKEGFETTVEYVAPDHCPKNGKVYDGIVLGWGAYNHIKGRKKRIALLKEINSHLDKGSPVLISYWWANENRQNYLKKIAKVNRFFKRFFSKNQIEEGDSLTEFSGHFYTLNEVSDELIEAGFRVAYESGIPYGHTVGFKQ